MHLTGPRNSVVYLRLDAPATLIATAGKGLVRVLRDTGYPHDLKVSSARVATLKAGRTFTPLIADGAGVRIEADGVGEAQALALCANCFAIMWRHPLDWSGGAEGLAALERAFWADESAHACPRCRAAAAKPH